MKILPVFVGLCSTCGRPLNENGECLACLVRIGFDEPAGAATASPASLVFGDFEVEQRPDGFYWELGHGAMGVTYLAMDKVLRRRVALKVIDVPAVPTRRDSQAMRDRFLREARAAAALRHPNVAAVFQFGASSDASHCYYAMELVEGETLEARIRRDGPLKAEPALEIAMQITRALMAAAAQGLIHRDLKPGNVMLTPGNAATTELEVKVIDFGLAKAIADAGGEADLRTENLSAHRISRALSNLEAARSMRARIFIRSAPRSGSRSPGCHHTLAARSKRCTVVGPMPIYRSSSWSRGKFPNR